MGWLAWLRKQSRAEALVLKALLEFAEGDQRTALGDLMQGLIELSEGTGASVVLQNLQTRMANFNLLSIPTPTK